MISHTHHLLYPDGATQEIPSPIPFNALVDINGAPLPSRISNTRIIAYRVIRISTREERNETKRVYYLELVSVAELNRIYGR